MCDIQGNMCQRILDILLSDLFKLSARQGQTDVAQYSFLFIFLYFILEMDFSCFMG